MAHKQRILPVQERAQQMRRTLLDATVHILETEGSARLTTTAIVTRAHVSSGTFYRYFNDKAEIIAVLRDEAIAAISSDLMAAVVRALDLDLAGGVRLIVDALVGAFEQHRAVILAMVDTLPAGPNANVLPQVESDLYRLATVLPRRHRPGLSPERLDAMVFMTMGVLVSTCLRIALQRPPAVPREELIDIAAAMVLAGFQD